MYCTPKDQVSAKRFTNTPPKRSLSLLGIHPDPVPTRVEVNLVNGDPFGLVGQLEEHVQAQYHRSSQVHGEERSCPRLAAYVLDGVDGYPDLGDEDDYECRKSYPGAPHANGRPVD